MEARASESDTVFRPDTKRSIISASAKRPRKTGTTGTPSRRYSMPNVKRSSAVRGSSPTNPTVRPSPAAISPLSTARRLTSATVDRPQIARRRSSGGPTARTIRRTAGRRATSMMTPTVEPSAEAAAEHAMAVRASPRRAIG
jgi:hypothetical protein